MWWFKMDTENKNPKLHQWVLVWRAVALVELTLLTMLLFAWLLVGGSNEFNRVEKVTFEPTEYAYPQLDAESIEIELVGTDYKLLWAKVSLPGMAARDTDYPLTGNNEADKYIRELGEARGYKRQPVASSSLVEADSYPVQPATANAWQKLETAAAREGVELSLSSGYRSADEQRSIFLDFLQLYSEENINPKAITSGQLDDALQRTLDRVAPPGYSKHHTGYAIDVCDEQLNACATRFANTPGELWLSRNNYANAKRFGFIPSYPPYVENQGPNPEPWEFIWIGNEPLTPQGFVDIYTQSP